MSKLVLIKLGGSLITDKSKPLYAHKELIEQLAREIAQIKSNNTELAVVVGTGAGSFGHYLVKKNGMGKTGSLPGNETAVAEIHESVKNLNKKLVDALKKNKQELIQLSAMELEVDKDALNSVRERIISIYGDIVARADTYEVLSTEELFDLVISRLSGSFDEIGVVFATSVPGVINSQGKLISLLSVDEVSQVNWQQQYGYDVTGGMKQKVEAAARMLEKVRFVRIIDGKKPGNIKKAVEDKNVGTLIKR